MVDCRVVGEEEPIRQGDIFVSHEENNEWLKLGIILTADCDIAQNKNRGNLTYAPLITLKTYLNDVWLMDELIKVSDKLLAQLSEKIHTYHKILSPNATKLTQVSLLNWLKCSSSDEIFHSLEVVNPNEKADFAELHASFIEIQNMMSKPTDFTVQVEKYFTAKSQLNGSKKPLQLNSKRKQLSQAINQLRSDVFFINDIPNTDDIGFLAMLRNFSQIDETKLVCSRIEWYQNRDNYYRIARLHDVYKYAISQQFGVLFSRIGMPSEFEEFQAAIIEDFCETHILEI